MEGDVAAADMPATISDLADRVLDGKFNLEALQAVLVEKVVAKSGGNIAVAARELGLSRSQVAYRLRKRRRNAAAGTLDHDGNKEQAMHLNQTAACCSRHELRPASARLLKRLPGAQRNPCRLPRTW